MSKPQQVTVRALDAPRLIEVVLACQGIFAALMWIDGDNVDRIAPERVADTREKLVLAGQTLCELARNRY